jgi:FkbM family methyltransferase
MLIPIRSLVRNWSVNPKGVLHIGAHKAEESTMYHEYEWGHVIWVEAQSELVEDLRRSLDPMSNTVIQAVCWSISGLEFEFNVASNGHSSSLLEFGTHAGKYPEISIIKRYRVITKRLDEILNANDKFDFVTIDVQGAELEVLKGLGERISTVNWIYTEVNNEEVYHDCAKVSEIDQYLREYKFSRVATRWVPKKGWGDALYVREGFKQKKDISCHLEDLLWNLKEYSRIIIKEILKKLDS